MHFPWSTPSFRLALTGKRALVWAKSHGRCWYCGERLRIETFHVDHVVPRARGGGGELVNLVPACIRCNLRKGARDLETFRALEARRLGKRPGRLAWLGVGRRRFYFERAKLQERDPHP